MRKSIIIVSILVLLPFSVQAVQYGFYGRGRDQSFHKGMYETIHTYNRTPQNSLGLSTELSLGSSGQSGYGSGSVCGGADVVYVKTGGSRLSSEGYSATLSSRLPEMAKTTTSSFDNENSEVSTYGFLESPDYSYDTPIGDAVIPLLLLLLPLVLYKMKIRW